MSTTILNFEKAEVVATNKKEAIEMVTNIYGHCRGEATQAYKIWLEKQHGVVSDRALKEFMLDYLNKKTKNCPGDGCFITLESAVSDTRERPYVITDVKNEHGKRKYKKVYQVIDDETGLVLAEVLTNKADAKNKSKELIKNGFHGKISCKLAHKVVEGQEVVFTAEYAPSKNTKPGRYMVFGIKKD